MKKQQKQVKPSRAGGDGVRSLKNAKTNAPRFQRLAQAIAAAPAARRRQPGRRAPLSHEECQTLLEFYVDGEMRGENTRTAFPAIHDHLKTCEECRMSYAMMTSKTGDENREFLAAASRRALPFLGRGAPDAPWSKHVHSAVGGGPLGFVLTIDPGHLARVIVRPPQYALRGQVTSDRSLLLLDSIALGSRDVQVALWLHPTASPDRARLEISVVSSSPLPEPLRVNLQCDDHSYAAPIKQNVGWIDQIPLAALESTPVSFEFQAGQPPPLLDE